MMFSQFAAALVLIAVSVLTLPLSSAPIDCPLWGLPVLLLRRDPALLKRLLSWCWPIAIASIFQVISGEFARIGPRALPCVRRRGHLAASSA
jgi:hypothetical protein